MFTQDQRQIAPPSWSTCIVKRLVGIVLICVLLVVLVSEQVHGQCQTNQRQILAPPDLMPNDALGQQISISGDYAVIGANNAGGTGAVYVFKYDGSTWSELAKLSACDLPSDAKFGRVSIDGDTIVIGAAQDDDGGWYSGSAFVFTKPEGGDWATTDQPTAKLTASEPATNDLFGCGVAISGDIIVVGSTNDDDAGTNSGSTYLFERPADGWEDMTQTVKLTRRYAEALDGFGRSVAIEGDTVVVGALSQSGGESFAYVFEKGTGGWVDGWTNQVGILFAADGGPGHKFGRNVAINGGTTVVGAEQIHLGPGAAYVFEKVAGSWVQQAKLTASYGAMNDLLGSNLTIHGDIIVAGARGYDGAGSNSGSAYLFKRPTGGWQDMIETIQLTASEPSASAQFGLDVALGDGVLIVGAHGVDQTRGSAYVFSVTCNQPPVITCNGPVSLWPPNHRLVDASSALTVWDPDGDDATLTVRVFSDEPEGPEVGDDTGDHAPDFKNEYPDGRGLLVRAERQGDEDGRVYIFLVTASDGVAETTAVCAAAVVPHDRSPASRASALAQAADAQAVIQDAVENGDPLPPAGFYEHGLSGPIGPKQ